MAAEKRIRTNLIVQKVSFVFVTSLLVGGAVFIVYILIRSRSYRYEVFWIAALAELVLLLLFMRLPNRGVYRVVRLFTWFLALLGPALVSSLSPDYRPARGALFVFFLGISVFAIPRFFRLARGDIKKLEAQLGRIKVGLPIEDEIPSRVSKDETIELKRRFNTLIERTYTVKGNKDVISEKIQHHFKQSGYKQAYADGAIIFTRGRGPITFSPKDWLSMADVYVAGEAGTVKVELWLGVDLRGQIVMPWERAFWRAELGDFEKVFSVTELSRESEKANKKATWLNLVLAVGYLTLIVAVPLGIFISIISIIEERFPDYLGIAGLIFIAIIIFAVVFWLRNRNKVLW